MRVLDRVSAVLRQKGKQIWFVHPDATVYEALETMADKEIGALLVMDSRKPLGMISERDYARKIILNGRSSRDTKVHEIMSSALVTIGPDSTIDDAMRLMTEHRIRHLPVLGTGDEVLGVVSIGDLVKWTISSQEQTIEQLANYISGQT